MARMRPTEPDAAAIQPLPQPSTLPSLSMRKGCLGWPSQERLQDATGPSCCGRHFCLTGGQLSRQRGDWPRPASGTSFGKLGVETGTRASPATNRLGPEARVGSVPSSGQEKARPLGYAGFGLDSQEGRCGSGRTSREGRIRPVVAARELAGRRLWPPKARHTAEMFLLARGTSKAKGSLELSVGPGEGPVPGRAGDGNQGYPRPSHQRNARP